MHGEANQFNLYTGLSETNASNLFLIHSDANTWFIKIVFVYRIEFKIVIRYQTKSYTVPNEGSSV